MIKKIVIYIILALLFFIGYQYDKSRQSTSLIAPITTPTIAPTLTIAPTPLISPIPTRAPIFPTAQTFPSPTEEWGKAKQIGDVTYTMKIQMDDRMTTPKEIFEALNIYRSRNQRSQLEWDNRLAEYANTRAKHFTELGKLDAHAGFKDYTNNIDNVKKLGFWSLGENSSYGYRLLGVHIIEWVYAADEPHNNNQLSPDWSHVGIGVDGNQTALIFGGNKM